jgi:type VI protein secretion system component VasF
MQKEILDLRTEMRNTTQDLRAETRQNIQDLRADMRQELSETRTSVQNLQYWTWGSLIVIVVGFVVLFLTVHP